MAFRCGICNAAQESGTAPVVLITEKREVSYPQRMKDKKIIDPGGNGWETVSTVDACAKCAGNVNEQS